jgi:hypothetical protein
MPTFDKAPARNQASAEAPRAQRDARLCRQLFDAAVVHEVPVRVVEIQGERAAAHVHAGRPVQAHHRPAVAVLQREQLGDQPARQALHARLDRLDADALQVAQTGFHRRNAQVVQRAVLEPGLAFGQHMHAPLHRGEVDRAAAEPGAPQGGERLVAHQQAAHAGGVAEHLVERHHHEIGRHGAQVQAAGGHEGGGVQQHVPALRARGLHQIERVLDP